MNDWQRIEEALKDMGLKAPQNGDPINKYIALLADNIEKLKRVVLAAKEAHICNGDSQDESGELQAALEDLG